MGCDKFFGKNLDNAQGVGRKAEHQDDASQRGNLPEGWVVCTLNDIGDIQTGNTPPKNQPELYGDHFPIFKPGDLDSGICVNKASDYLSQAGRNVARFVPAKSTYVTCIGATIGKTGFVIIDGTCNQQINTVSPGAGIVPKWIYFWISSPQMQNEIVSNSSSTTLPILNKSKFSNLNTVLPPLAEQQQIAQKLDELLAQVDTLKTRLDAIPKILKRFRQSVLAAAVSGRLTEGVPFEVKTLGDIIEVGPQNGIYKPSSFYGQGSRIVRIDGFYDGEMCGWEKIKRVQLEKDELSKWQLNVSDILINRVNSIEYLGKCALVRTLPEPAVFESNIMRIKLDLRAPPEIEGFC